MVCPVAVVESLAIRFYGYARPMIANIGACYK